jgi:PiT family inorganic phosphate transporter
MFWNLFSFWQRVPVSISQSLFGALIGAAWITSGPDSLISSGMVKLAIGLFASPLIGIVMGYLMVKVVYAVTAAATPRMNKWLQWGQVIVSLLMAMTVGSNDAQKLMGVLVLGMFVGGFVDSTTIPAMVTIMVSATMMIGALVSGWALIRKLGTQFYKIRPVHGFGAQGASAATIFGASAIGLPVSVTQVVTSSIIGAGSADRLQMVRWGIFNSILWGWVLTIPITAILGAVLTQVLKGILS